MEFIQKKALEEEVLEILSSDSNKTSSLDPRQSSINKPDLSEIDNKANAGTQQKSCCKYPYQSIRNFMFFIPRQLHKAAGYLTSSCQS